jgi:hypothetical protein
MQLAEHVPMHPQLAHVDLGVHDGAVLHNTWGADALFQDKEKGGAIAIKASSW